MEHRARQNTHHSCNSLQARHLSDSTALRAPPLVALYPNETFGEMTCVSVVHRDSNTDADTKLLQHCQGIVMQVVGDSRRASIVQ